MKFLFGRLTIPTSYLIANKIEAGQVDVISVTRLGKKVNNKNRLMKVQVASLSQKRRLLMNAKKLKQCSGDFQNIYLTPDLSYNERNKLTGCYDRSCLIAKNQVKLI